MKYKILLVLFLTMSLMFSSCHHVVKDDQFLMSNEQEVKLGAEVHKHLLKQFKLYQNPTVNQYVRKVGKKVVKKCDRKDIQYHFYVLDDPMINAFAGPGGYVYVTTGLLGFMKNEAELACIMGHEIGHITERHAAKRMRELRGYQVLAVGLAVAGVGIDPDLLSLGASLALNGYSQKNEYEADEKGIIYANRAGYNPNAMQNFFLRLEQKANDKHQYNTVKRLLSSHPPTRSRINRAHKIEKEHNMMGVNDGNYYVQQFSQIKFIVNQNNKKFKNK